MAMMVVAVMVVAVMVVVMMVVVVIVGMVVTVVVVVTRRARQLHVALDRLIEILDRDLPLPWLRLLEDMADHLVLVNRGSQLHQGVGVLLVILVNGPLLSREAAGARDQCPLQLVLGHLDLLLLADLA